MRHALAAALCLGALAPATAGAVAINLIQQDVATLATNQTQVTVTIQAVDPAKSLLFFDYQLDNVEAGDGAIRGRLASATSVVFERGGQPATSAATISWKVVEFASGMSVQRGTLTGANSSSTYNVTLSSAVDPDKSFVLASWSTGLSDDYFSCDNTFTARLTSATNLELRARCDYATFTKVVDWQVAQCADCRVQRGTGTIPAWAGKPAVYPALSTQVDVAKSIVLTTASSSGSVYGGSLGIRAYLRDDGGGKSGTVIVDRLRTGTDRDLLFTYEVVEFTDAWTRVKSGLATQNNATTATTISTLVNDPSRRCLALLSSTGLSMGATAYGGGYPIGPGLFTTRLSSPSTGLALTVQRQITGSANAEAAWSVVTFQPLLDVQAALAGPAAPVRGGQNYDYTVTLTNGGPATYWATAVTAVLTLPASATYVSHSGTDWGCTLGSGNKLTCTLPGNLGPPPATSAFTVTVTAPDADASLAASLAVSAYEPDPNTANNAAAATTTVHATADLSVLASASAAQVGAGKAVDYTLKVANAGPLPAASVALTHTLPSGFAFVSAAGSGWSCGAVEQVVTCTLPTLAAGASAAEVGVRATASPEPGTFTAVARVDAVEKDGKASNDEASASVTVTGEADLSVALSATPNPVTALGTAGFAVEVTNAGPSTATGVSVALTLPAGSAFASGAGGTWTCAGSGATATCTLASLPPGKSSFTVQAKAPADGGSYTAAATVSAQTADPAAANDGATADLVVDGVADLSVTAASNPASAPAGSQFAWVLTVRNGGPSKATGWKLTQTIPSEATFVSASGAGWHCPLPSGGAITCNGPALASGASSVLTLNLRAPVEPTALTGTAKLAPAQIDPEAANGTATVSTQVTASADLSVELTDSPDPAVAASPVTYSVKVRSAGPSGATGVKVALTWSAGKLVSLQGAGFTCASSAGGQICALAGGLTPSQSAALTLELEMPASGGKVAVAAAVSSSVPDPKADNDSAAAETTVTASADLGVALTDDPDPVEALQTVTYTVTVTNAGPSDASAVQVLDRLPAGTSLAAAAGGSGFSCQAPDAQGVLRCSLATLAKGASAVLKVPLRAPRNPTTLTNAVEVSSAQADPKASNDEASETTAVNGVADLSAQVAKAADPVSAGAAIAWTVNAANAGPSDASDVKVDLELPSNLSAPSLAGTGWTCGPIANAKATCALGPLASGSSSALTVSGRAAPEAGTMTLGAQVRSSQRDPAPGNEWASATTSIAAVADLRLVLAAAPSPVAAGAELTYTAAAVNEGPSTATRVTFSLTLPKLVTLISASGPGATCDSQSGTVTCRIPTLAASGNATITLKTLAPNDPGIYVAQGLITGLESDPVQANNPAKVAVSVMPGADLSLRLEPAKDSVDAGDELEVEARVANAGPSAASSVEVRLGLPEGVPGRAAGEGWTCQELTCTRPALSKGEEAVLTLTAIPAQGGELTVSGEVSAATPDQEPDNDEDSATVHVAQAKLDNPGTAMAAAPEGLVAFGSTVRFTLTVENAGDAAAKDVAAWIELPEGLALVEGTLTAEGTFPGPLWLKEVPAGERKQLSLSAQVIGAPGSALRTAAKVVARGLPELRREVENQVARPPALGLELTTELAMLAPGQATKLSAKLTGSTLPAGASLALTLPAGMKAVAGSAKSGAIPLPLQASASGAAVTLPEIPPKGIQLQLEVEAREDAAGAQAVQAQVIYQGQPASNLAAVEIQIGEVYDLGGCGCGSGGEPAALGLLALSLVAIRIRRVARR